MPFRCFAHIINLASKDMIKAAENIGLNQIVKLRNTVAQITVPMFGHFGKIGLG